MSNRNDISAKSAMPKLREVIYITLFLMLIIVLWAGPSVLSGPELVKLPLTQGGYDLSANDFENHVYETAPGWDSWPEKLYAPEELAGAGAPVPHKSLDYTKTQYATHRLRLNLPPGAVYGISLYSSNFSMRIYIDGVEVDCVGVPGASREETTPQMRQAVYYFVTQSENTEIVVQAANFVYREGGRAPTLTIGSAEAIARYERTADLESGLLFGCLVTACLYNLAIFLMNRRQVSSLVFSGICLLLAYVSRDFPSLLMQAYNWQIAIRAEYLCYVVAANALLLLICLLFRGALHRWCVRAYLIASSLFVALILFTDSTFFTRLLIGFQAISVALIVYSIVRLFALTLRERKRKNILAFTGIMLLMLFIVGDILSRYGIYVMGQAMRAATGMALFVFCYAMVLSIEQAEINVRLDEARTALDAAEARYNDLAQARAGGDAPVARISDFGLTRRETDVTLLLLDGKSREEIAALLCISMGTVNTHCSNVYRKTGCGSVADLVRKLQPGVN